MVRDNIHGVPVRKSIMKDVAAEYNVAEDDLLETLQMADSGIGDVAQELFDQYHATDADQDHTEIGGDADLLLVSEHEWDEILADLPNINDRNEPLGRAVRAVHNRMANEHGFDTGAMDGLAMWSPPVYELEDAGLSFSEARARYMYAYGVDVEGIADEMDVADGTVKSYLQRARNKRQDAEKLLEVLSRYER